MAVMLSKTYDDALVAAGVPQKKARETAEELAAYENPFATIERDFAVLKTDMTAWCVNLAASLSIAIKVFV